jgi:hypothetical protein
MGSPGLAAPVFVDRDCGFAGMRIRFRKEIYRQVVAESEKGCRPETAKTAHPTRRLILS